jgi:hypothetical protein
MAVAAIILLGLSAGAVAQTLPADTYVAYWIHEQPGDPESPVAFSVTLSLQAVASYDSSVGWKIASVELRQPGTGGGDDLVWADSAPVVDTPDGLWWVSHADMLYPQRSEFYQLPMFWGVGEALESLNEDIEYAFDGPGSVPLIEAPYAVTTKMDFYVAYDGDPDPVTNGQDEPVEIPDEPDPPGTQG